LDVNGTRFHLLLGEEDWGACSDGRARVRPAAASPPEGVESADLSWDGERGELTLSPLLFQFATPPKDTPPSLSVRRGAARDRYGDWYWVDATARRVLVLREAAQTVETFWPKENPPAAPAAPAGDFVPREVETPAAMRFLGVAVTGDQYLVVGVLEPAGLLVFDLYADDAPLRIVWPEAVPFAPFDMVAAPAGGLWILDRDNRRFWALDRHFNVLPQGQEETALEAGGRDDFQPLGATADRRTPPRTFPSGVSLDLASPLTADDPISIEALPDGTVLILDRNPTERFSLVYRYSFQRQLGRALSVGRMERLMRPEDRTGFRLSAYDFAYVPAHDEPEGRVPDRLYFAAEDGNQVFAFAVHYGEEQFELEPLPDYLPMRKFGGKGLVAGGTRLFYDFGGGWIPLVEQKRPRFLQEATLYTPIGPDTDVADDDESAPRAFDGREPDCVWHRLMLDACLPPETEVLVESRAANDERELAGAEWRPEPRPYLRGSAELPFARRPSAEGAGTWELLFQKARGRYLQLRLTLKGNGRTTPRLRALRAYYPRFSYLEQYMPAVYREDPVSASFLDRFMSNFEGLYTSLEDRVAAAQLLFDVRSAPAETLEWLANWFGVALDPTWDEARRRLFIKHAPTFFAARGTVRGLQLALRLALDECPSDEIFDARTAPRAGGIRIIERYRTRQLPGAVVGDPTDGGPKRYSTQATRWRPEQGRATLNALYRNFLSERASATPARETLAGARFTAPAPAALKTDYTLLPPAGEEARESWSQFSREVVGFVPTTSAVETALWQDFLKRRHRQIQQLNDLYKSNFKSFAQVYLPGDMPVLGVRVKDWLDFMAETNSDPSAARRARWQNFLARRYYRLSRLNAAYGTHWPSFELVSLPEELPADGAALADWYQFEGVVVPMQDAAHRFTVLLPMRASAALDTAEEQRRQSLAERIVNLEKPAHTIFDMKFYWELFRLGQARLGEDTVIDLGGRAPQLMSPLTLGRGHLAESYLAARRPTPADRQVLGRDPLAG
jgi:phage tail-like protein